MHEKVYNKVRIYYNEYFRLKYTVSNHERTTTNLIKIVQLQRIQKCYHNPNLVLVLHGRKCWSESELKS